MNFINFIGNEKVKEQLSFLEASNRLPHAIVIEGDEGLGKKTLARDIALNLLCKSDDEKPCMQCPQCSKVSKGIHPDVYEYCEESRTFKVEKVRDIRDDVFVSPNEANYKIYVLGNCQFMNDSAQNAILKVLEEPPEYAVFILTTTTKSALLETVLSRSVVISVEGVDAKLGADYICSNDDSVDYNDALSAMTVWNGNIGKAMQSLSDGKLSKISTISNDICKSLVSENEYDLLTACAVFERDRDMLINVLSHIKTIFRDALLYSNKSDVLSGNAEMAKLLASRFNKQKILKLIEACDNIRVLAMKNGNNAILITKICYELRRAQNR